MSSMTTEQTCRVCTYVQHRIITIHSIQTPLPTHRSFSPFQVLAALALFSEFQRNTLVYHFDYPTPTAMPPWNNYRHHLEDWRGISLLGSGADWGNVRYGGPGAPRAHNPWGDPWGGPGMLDARRNPFSQYEYDQYEGVTYPGWSTVTPRGDEWWVGAADRWLRECNRPEHFRGRRAARRRW